MAVAPKPNEILRSTNGKDNFHRLTRLLISGGTELLRETFDSRCPPASLPTILQNPATKKLLNAAKLTIPQRDCLYPSPGVYGKSTDCDVTLLFKLLRTICSLTPPVTGWDAQPSITDHSLEADLARIKYHRNTVYGHVKSDMEIEDDFQFLTLWREISEALVRIADQIYPSKKHDWQAAIDKFLKDPLTAEDERYVEELCDWYRQDLEVKKSVEEVQETSRVINEKVEDLTSAVGEIKDILEEKMNQFGDAAEKIRSLSDLLGACQSIKEYQTSKNGTGSDKQAGVSRVSVPRAVEGFTKDGSQSEVLLDEITRKCDRIQSLEGELFHQTEKLRYMAKEIKDTLQELKTKEEEYFSNQRSSAGRRLVVSLLCTASSISGFFLAFEPVLSLVNYLFTTAGTLYAATSLCSKKRGNDYNLLFRLLVKLQQSSGQFEEVLGDVKTNSVSYAQSLDDFVSYMNMVTHSGIQVCIPDILIEKYTLALRIRKEFPFDEIRKEAVDITKIGEVLFMSGHILA